MTLDLTLTARIGKAHVPFLRRSLLKAHPLLKSALVEMSVALVNDKTMSDLHVQFMDIQGPTDVLTFPLDFDPCGRVTSGEVVVCVPYAKRTAKQHGTDLKHELLLYALHGMLHLCGFDDRTDADFAKMHRKEDEILRRIGVGPVFKAQGGLR